MCSHVTVLDHSVVQHHLTCLRDRSTAAADFRRHMEVLAVLLLSEATRTLPTQSVTVETPLETAAGRHLAGRVAAVPILRAGLIFTRPLLDLVPQAEVWHLGMYRDEQTAQPVHYYQKLPAGDPPDVALVLDPMLATGGSAGEAVRLLRQRGIGDVRMVSVIAAPEGISCLRNQHPDVPVFCCAIDRELNDRRFICPGLGDAGDRLFGT